MDPFLIITSVINKLFYRIPIFNYERNITYKLKTFNRITFNTKKRENNTIYGKFMKFTRIATIPMFYNVLKGETSVVGLKPQTKSYLTEKDGFESIQFRKNVKVGILSYENMHATDSTVIDDTLRFDIYYVTNASLFEDTKIILVSFAKLFSRKSTNIIKGNRTNEIE